MNNNIDKDQARDIAMASLQGSTSASGSDERSWYLAFAKAWGNTLDNQANKLAEMSEQISDGQDSPASITKLTAESLRFGFLTQNSATSLNTTGEALKTMASKN
jgi:hypothetical protein